MLWIRENAKAMRWSANQLILLIACEDITERYWGELESSRLAAIVSSSDDAIVSKTIDGKITSWNAGATNIFGYEAAEMIGHPITRIIPPELHQEENQILMRLRRGERVHHYRDHTYCQGRPPRRRFADRFAAVRQIGKGRGRIENRPRHQ